MYTFIEIARSRAHLFTHTPSYYVPEVAAGRNRERKEAIDALKTLPEGGIVIISEMVGSGKTFLLRLVCDEMIRQGTMNPDETPIVSVRELDETILRRETDSTILILDEIDKKSNDRDKMLATLGIANQLLGDSKTHMVLSGDYMLKDEEVLDKFSRRSKTCHVQLDGLTPELFQEAMTNRASYFNDTKDKASVINDIFSDEILPYLLPKTMPQVATFREVLACLSQLTSSEVWPLKTSDCLITGDLLSEWFSMMPAATFNPAQIEFLDWLRTVIMTCATESEGMRPFTAKDCREAAPIRGIATDAEYESKILDPLVCGNVLRGFGIPHKEGIAAPRREPGPYLPASMTFLRAAFDEWWLEPES